MLKRILPSLKEKLTHGLHFNEGTFKVTVFFDVNWAISYLGMQRNNRLYLDQVQNQNIDL